MNGCFHRFALWLAAGSLCLAGVLQAAEPPAYYQAARGLTGTALRTAVNTIIKTGHVPVTYDEARTSLRITDRDPANSARVILLYTGESKHGVNDWLNNNSADGWNREHVWPNSLGIDDHVRAYPDLMNLRPCDEQVNNDRGNLPFDESDPAASGYQKPAHAEAPACSQDSNSWEPPTSMKGDIARALFYMDLRYEGANGEPNLQLTDNLSLINNNASYMGKLSTLLVWHFLDPVDAEERSRNDRVQAEQGNRNPFVDRPEWVEAIYGPVFQLRVERVGTQIKIRWPALIPSTLGIVETSASASPGASWQPLTGTVTVEGTWNVRLLPLTKPPRFYRLKLMEKSG